MRTMFMKRAAFCAAAVLLAGAAQAAFEGRDASGAVNGSCTATRATKCTYFYDTTLDITILNNWNIGTGNWSASADPGSAQALAASAGLTASGLTGWVLPTGNVDVGAGAQNQYLSIWDSVGRTFEGMSSQFDGVQPDFYWSDTEWEEWPIYALRFRPTDGWLIIALKHVEFYAVAVRPGDVALVPEPGTGAMMLLALGAMVVAVRRRPR